MFEESQYGQELPTWKSTPILHASHMAPRPESLIDLNYNKRAQEENALIAIGQGLNSLGKPLVVSESKLHLIPSLEKWRVRYVVKA